MALEDLPPEILERTVVLLSLRDVCALRLSSRTLASKATQDYFKTFFTRKRVEVTELGLQKFVDCTAAGGLNSLIKHLTLVAPVYNTLELEFGLENKVTTAIVWAEDGSIEDTDSRDLTTEELSQMSMDLPILRTRQEAHAQFVASGGCVTLLAQAFDNLAKHNVALDLVATEVAVYRLDAVTPIPPLYGGGFKYIWQAASDVFHTLFGSIARAGLRVNRLDLFNGPSMHRCSLSCDQFTSVDFDAAALDACLGNLRSLTMSISDKVMKQSSKEPMSLQDYSSSDPDVWEDNVFATDQELLLEAERRGNFTGICSMLQRCKLLEDLTVSRYSLDWLNPEISQAQTDGVLTALQDAASSSIRRLALQGFDAYEFQILGLLWALPNLECVSFRCITLLEGSQEGTSWRDILDHCTEHVDTVHLDTLRDTLGSVIKELIFEPPHAIKEERSKATYRRTLGVSDDQGKDARQVRYTLRQERYSRTPEVRAREQGFKNEFGPPGYGGEAMLRDVFPPEEIWQLMP